MNMFVYIMSCFDCLKNIMVDYMGSEGEGNVICKLVLEYMVWIMLFDLMYGEMMVCGYNDINYKIWFFFQFKNVIVFVFEKINVKG